MATGFLQVMVTTQTAIPLENVKITVIDSASGKLLEDRNAEDFDRQAIDAFVKEATGHD